VKNSEIQNLIGKSGRLEVEKNFIVAVTILDARSAFGRMDLEVTPANGSGSKWVSMERVTVSQSL
jgi:hypothetical protein